MMVQLQENAPSDEDKSRVDRCFDELQAVIAQLGPRWRTEIFGSVASRFSTNTSDMDATCTQARSEEEDEEDQEPDSKEILLERLSPLFRNTAEFSVIEEIPSAKVPLLRLRFEDHLDIDLSCHNHGALRNTRLLRAYANLDARIRDLGIAVKLWAKAAGVVGAAQSKLSSYTFTLLMIYFVQVHHEVKVPCLSPGLFEENANPETRDNALRAARDTWCEVCQLGLPDLFFRFICFYTTDFEWGREVVSTRIGQRRYSNDSVFQTLRGRYVPRLHVEDPYLLQRNLHCVLGDVEEEQLREAFQIAWQTMLTGRTPVGLQMHGGKMEIQLSELTGQSPQSSPDFGPAPAPDLWPMTPANTMDVTEASEAGGAFPAEPPGILSSSGSTESGDACPPLEPCSSAESRSSDDELTAGATPGPPHFRTLRELENAMVHKSDIVAIARNPMATEMADMVTYGMVGGNSPTGPGMEETMMPRSPFWGAQPSPAPSGNDQWWRNLGGLGNHNGTKEEISYGQQKSNGSVFRLEELEAQHNKPKSNGGVFTVEDLERQMTHKSSEDSVNGGKGISPLFGKSFAASATSKIASRISSRCYWQAHSSQNAVPVYTI
jgi:hypothetical protein